MLEGLTKEANEFVATFTATVKTLKIVSIQFFENASRPECSCVNT